MNKNVSGVQAAAEGTKGYVANVQLMLDSKVEAGFSNTKLAYDAHHAQGTYAGQAPGQIVGWMSIKPRKISGCVAGSCQAACFFTIEETPAE